MIQNCMSEQQRRNAVQILLTLDKKDYEEGMPVFEKYSTRGVIIRDGKIATQHGSAGDYKILGGGVEPGEKLEDARRAGQSGLPKPSCSRQILLRGAVRNPSVRLEKLWSGGEICLKKTRSMSVTPAFFSVMQKKK